MHAYVYRHNRYHLSASACGLTVQHFDGHVRGRQERPSRQIDKVVPLRNMCTCIYVCKYIYKYIHVRSICIRKCARQGRASLQIDKVVSLRYLYTCICICVRMYIYIYIFYIYIYTYIHICIYMYIYARGHHCKSTKSSLCDVCM